MICYQDEQATIEYLLEEQAIYCSWQGEVGAEQFQQVMKHKLMLMKSLSTASCLLDICHMQAINYDNQQWLLETWMPAISGLPVRKIAIIQSLDVYNGMVVEDLLRHSPENPGCEVQLFADYEACLAWIRDFSESDFQLQARLA